MPHPSPSISRRSFLKSSTLAGGGLMLSFSWLGAFALADKKTVGPSKELTQLNGFLKIAEDGTVTIMSPNPEAGQNVKTSMPMIVAEELDVDWKQVVVEQAPLNTRLYSRQFLGGSQAIRTNWKTLRTAGATARQMLREAAARDWKVPVDEVTTEGGTLFHRKSGKSAGYGAMASKASKIAVPGTVTLKNKSDFRIIGTSPGNVDDSKIVSGKPLYGIDIERKGMLHAMVIHPPAFGMKLKSIEESSITSLPGIRAVFPIKIYQDDYVREFFDTCTFNEVVAIVGNSTWEVMKARKSLKVQWEPFSDHTIQHRGFSGPVQTVTIPGGLESTPDHQAYMTRMMSQPGTVLRKDGDPQSAFDSAARIIEQTYTAPFLAHNCMEPLNFFADVRPDKAELAGPLQKAELTERALSARLGMPVNKIDIQIMRLGGGFGRKSYAHFLIEAALISQRVKAPVKLLYSREDDMTSGIYRPTYRATFRAALNAKNELVGFHVKGGGIPTSPMDANLFPAGAVDHYLAESWEINSNITQGSFRAPRYNFMAAAGESFLDELAEATGKDPFTFRLDLLDRAIKNPVGQSNEYDPRRFSEVLKLVREKSGWGTPTPNTFRGVASFFCMNTYAAQVMDLRIENGKLTIPRVCCALDCGIVINPDSATNLSEGAIVDGLGNALFGAMTFEKGKPEKNNFNTYRMIRQHEAPKSIDVHFVKSEVDPTGMGEPPFPPTFGALANALYKATGTRFYDQPFGPRLDKILRG
ncbi:MAG: xanthine dehydrogenase family protein molybdopterin-binding subunit [Bacteroidota bacterium]|nr:xanthine dehydrogenase family protein molybdopterin-binding subunit [Bacteroidota bacterium]